MRNHPNAPSVTLVERRHGGQNGKWRIYFDHVRGRDGIETADHLVIAPKIQHAGLVSGVAVVPVTAEGIVLLQTYRHAVDGYGWEIPRGFAEPEEDPMVSARRELEEEAGLTCDPEKFVPLGRVAPEASTIAGRAALFAALDCHPGGERDGGEPGLGEPCVFPVDEVQAMLARFEIEDAITVAALYRFFQTERGA